MPAVDDEHERTASEPEHGLGRPAAFDPRHDPIFQPGYDGAADSSRALPQRGRRERPRPERADAEERRQPDAVPRGPVGGDAGTPSASDVRAPAPTTALPSATPEFAGGVPVVDLDAPQDDAADAAAGEPAPRRHGPLARLVANPFVWILLAFGLVLLIGGYQGYHGALEATYGDAYYVSSDADDADANGSYIDSQVTFALAPLSVLAGWAVIAATIVLCAVLWRRDRRDAGASVP